MTTQKLWLVFLGLLISVPAIARTELVAVPNVKEDPDKIESHFGEPAKGNNFGIDSGYPVDLSDSAYTSYNRAPASADTNKPKISSKIAKIVQGKGIQEISLIAGDLGYFPKTLFVVKDIPVRLYVTGASENSLCIMMDDFRIRKQVRAKSISEITFTPKDPGMYRFYCPVNGMEGTLVVKDLTSNIPQPEYPNQAELKDEVKTETLEENK